MTIAVITYDLFDLKADDNQNVKNALLVFTNTCAELQGFNILNPFPQHVILKMPDTTLTAQVIRSISPKQIADEVITVIRDVGATPDKVSPSLKMNTFGITKHNKERIKVCP